MVLGFVRIVELFNIQTRILQTQPTTILPDLLYMYMVIHYITSPKGPSSCLDMDLYYKKMCQSLFLHYCFCTSAVKIDVFCLIEQEKNH